MVDGKLWKTKAQSLFKKQVFKKNLKILKIKKFNIHVTQQCSWFSSLVQLQIFPEHLSQIKTKWLKVLEQAHSKLLLSSIETLSNFLQNSLKKCWQTATFIFIFFYLPVESKPLEPLWVLGNSSSVEHFDNFTIWFFSRIIWPIRSPFYTLRNFC